MKRILFVWVHNSGRSQMAEAFRRHLVGGCVEFTSAGTMPSERVNPLVVQVMKDRSIDISRNRPKFVTQGMLDGADRVVTMGCSVEEACPAVLAPTENWAIEDPMGKDIAKVREVHDHIEARFRTLLSSR